MEFLIAVWFIFGIAGGVCIALVTPHLLFTEQVSSEEKVKGLITLLGLFSIFSIPWISVYRGEQKLVKTYEATVSTNEQVSYHVVSWVDDEGKLQTNNFEQLFGVSYSGQKVELRYYENDSPLNPPGNLKFNKWEWTLVKE